MSVKASASSEPNRPTGSAGMCRSLRLNQRWTIGIRWHWRRDTSASLGTASTIRWPGSPERTSDSSAASGTARMSSSTGSARRCSKPISVTRPSVHETLVTFVSLTISTPARSSASVSGAITWRDAGPRASQKVGAGSARLYSRNSR